MKILKFIKSVLLDIFKIIGALICVILALGLLFLIGLIGILIITGSSALISKLFGGSTETFVFCIIVWMIGIMFLDFGINPVKAIKELVIDIKNYFKDKWEEI